jgi:hypothetical protein
VEPAGETGDVGGVGIDVCPKGVYYHRGITRSKQPSNATQDLFPWTTPDITR